MNRTQSRGSSRRRASRRVSKSIIVGLRPPAEENLTVEVIRFGLRQRPGE